MKYFIRDEDDYELQFKPSDDDGPDHVLWVTMDHPTDSDICGMVKVKVSDLYKFMDWLRNWAPDPR